jgi:hypothetical protein
MDSRFLGCNCEFSFKLPMKFSAPSAHDLVLRRVYGYFLTEDNSLQYIGSSHCYVKTLESNHRNAFAKYPKEAHNDFRYALQNKIKKGYFKTLIELKCNREFIETLEGELIRAFRPPYNVDMDPVKSSKRHNRY